MAALGFIGPVLATLPRLDAAEPSMAPILKVENFAKDPGWEGKNNRIMATQNLIVTQAFGYSATHFAGRDEGEMGGLIQRAYAPASYADAIAVKTMEDRLSAAGTFAVTASTPGGGVFLGYFNSSQPGGTGRPVGALGLEFNFDEMGGEVGVRLVTGGNKICGLRPLKGAETGGLRIRNDGTRYQWKLSYDPQGNRGHGRIQCVINSLGVKKEAAAQTFLVELPSEMRKEGAKFDRFGLMNLLTAGGAATMYCDDVEYDGKKEDFSIDPDWLNAGNRRVYEDHEQIGAQDFGFSGRTNFAGGGAGEVGGSFWRTDSGWAQYADCIEPVSLDQPLEASGKIALQGAGPEGEMYVGWFNSADAETPPALGRNFLGLRVGWVTTLGHGLTPAYATAAGSKERAATGLAMLPGKVYAWSVTYDPKANPGAGEIRLTLGGETVVLAVPASHEKEGGRFDRFGLFTAYPGGQKMKVYIDDLTYSVGGRMEMAKDGLGKN